jgi:hypothetical protein
MALLSVQQAALAGKAITFANATSGGDTLKPRSRSVLLVKNGDASAKTVTVVIPGNTEFGQPQPDVAVTVAAGAETLIGPFPAGSEDDTGTVSITYSAVTSVTVAHISL